MHQLSATILSLKLSGTYGIEPEIPGTQPLFFCRGKEADLKCPFSGGRHGAVQSGRQAGRQWVMNVDTEFRRLNGSFQESAVL